MISCPVTTIISNPVGSLLKEQEHETQNCSMRVLSLTAKVGFSVYNYEEFTVMETGISWVLPTIFQTEGTIGKRGAYHLIVQSIVKRNFIYLKLEKINRRKQYK